MNFRFKRDLRDGEVHVRGTSSVTLCWPSLAGAQVDYTDDPATCPECVAIRDDVQAASRPAHGGMTHGVRSMPTQSRAGTTWCGTPFAWRATLAQEGHAPHEVDLLRPADGEVDCMACVIRKSFNT